jgi:hypothetical protein
MGEELVGGAVETEGGVVGQQLTHGEASVSQVAEMVLSARARRGAILVRALPP